MALPPISNTDGWIKSNECFTCFGNGLATTAGSGSCACSSIRRFARCARPGDRVLHRLFLRCVVHQDDAAWPACASRLDTTANSTTAASPQWPTMGGIVLLSAIIILALLWSDPANIFVLMTIGAGVAGAALGAFDDIAKLHHRSSDHGLSRGPKYARQAAIGIALALILLLPFFSPIEEPSVRESFYLPMGEVSLLVEAPSAAPASPLRLSSAQRCWPGPTTAAQKL